MLAPRSKADYVELLNAHTKIGKDDLKAHTLERLKELWRAAKPKKAERVLPPSWKKLDAQSLKMLYEDHCIPYYGRPSDGHWVRWRRGQLVMELEIYENEVMEERKDQEDLGQDDQVPLCHNCGIKMMERTNRLTGDSFWGCLRYPQCRFTLPMIYDKKQTAHMQKEMAAQGRIPDPKANTNHAPISDRKRPGGSLPPPSETSWMPVQDEDENQAARTKNMNLSEAEVEKILAERARKGEEI